MRLQRLPPSTWGEMHSRQIQFTKFVVWAAITNIDDVTDKETTGKPSKCSYSLFMHWMGAWLGTMLLDSSDCTLPTICVCQRCILPALIELFDLVTLFQSKRITDKSRVPAVHLPGVWKGLMHPNLQLQPKTVVNLSIISWVQRARRSTRGREELKLKTISLQEGHLYTSLWMSAFLLLILTSPNYKEIITLNKNFYTLLFVVFFLPTFFKSKASLGATPVLKYFVNTERKCTALFGI